MLMGFQRVGDRVMLIVLVTEGDVIEGNLQV